MVRLVWHATPWLDLDARVCAELARGHDLVGLTLPAEVERREWLDAARASNLSIDAFCAGIEAAEVDRLEAAVDQACAAAERQAVRMVIARLHGATPPGGERNVDAWRALGTIAQRRGVTLAVDFSPSPVVDGRAMADFARRVDHPRVRLAFDAGAYAAWHEYSHWEVALQRVAPWLAALWLTDATGTPGDSFRPSLGQGVIDFARMWEIVRPLGFAGPAIVDVSPPRRGGATVSALESALREGATCLRRSGWFDR